MLQLLFIAFYSAIAILILISLINSRNIKKSLSSLKEEVAKETKSGQEFSANTLTQLATLTQNQLEQLTNQSANIGERSARQLNELRDTIDKKLEQIRVDNEKKLDQMRSTVDEKLQSTLERRLGESFKIVSDQLTTVNKSLGEMQSLADGVGDLKKVLSNVKSRGMMGEFQLHAILQDILTKDQYYENIATKKGSNERVEFAIRLPGGEENFEVLLPIDAKFPKEDYERLLDAQQQGDVDQIDKSRKAIRNLLKSEARSIRTKYINPPQTTDFALLFLPFEGLYAEVLNIAGLVDELQRDFRVVIAGPTTLAALLNSLQMGFRTLTIKKRSSEVWQLLGTIKNEFSKFGDLLDKTKSKLTSATNDLDTAFKRSELIQKRLNKVETDQPIKELEESTE